MSVTKRIAISKKTRFEVFKRDGFVCQYCGSTPPRVILHVDHIHPVKEGGTNHRDNLITSCEPCNLGKGAELLSVVPKSLRDKAAEVAEREEQIRGYNAVLQARAERLEDEAWLVAARIEGKDYIPNYQRARLLSIKRFLDALPYMEVIEAADITSVNFNYIGDVAFRYFCGICWRKIREFDHG